MIGYTVIRENRWKDVNHKLQKLNNDVVSATEFVRAIEKGDLDVSFENNAADSELKTSLVNMRDQMKQYSLAEKERNWVNEGLAKFVRILRSGNNDARQQLADNIIRSLVQYLNANQGALFALNDDDPNHVFLEMEACYAYDRKKFLEKRIALGEGMLGQVVLEKSTLYMTAVPKDFLKITSGLGEALPRNVLLVPLKLDEKVYGVVEIASFQIFQPYEIDFVERLGESIASTVAAVKNGERTRTLLKETQLQSEQLKAQEEEVRQNLEELSATQEAMQRAMKEVEAKEAYTSQILDTSTDFIYTVDSDFRMATWNASFSRESERLNIRLEKGMNAFEWSPDDRKKLIELYKRVFNGETFEITYEMVVNGTNYHFLSVYAPIKSPTGEIVEAGIYAKDVTQTVEAQRESARHLKVAQQQAEELKAQEEELRQNMEELSATQEAMQHALKDVESKEAYISQILNTSQDIIYTVDSDFRMATWNASFARYIELYNIRLEKGMNAFEWSPDDRQKVIELYKRVFNGETFEITYEIVVDGTTYHFLSVFAPIKSATGEIVEAGIYAKNVTPIVEAQRESARHLKEAQQQAEELKAQEEELRQNMEELSATQEAMQRALKDVESKESYIVQILNTSQDIIYTVDSDFRMATWNTSFARYLELINIRLEKGMNAFEWSPDDRQKLIELYKRVFNGETFEITYEIVVNETNYHYLSVYAPIKSATGEIVEAGIYARNVTPIVDAQQESARHLKEAQHKAEEMKAQEEELRQNMEELSATQDVMERATREAQQREEYISQILNASQAVVFTVDKDFKLVTWNDGFKKTLAGLGVQPEKGMTAFAWRPDNERQQFVELFQRVFEGETFETRNESKFDGTIHHFHSTYTPIKNGNNEIVEAAVFAKDITAIVSANKGQMENPEEVTVKRVNKKNVKTGGSLKHRPTPNEAVAPASASLPNNGNGSNVGV